LLWVVLVAVFGAGRHLGFGEAPCGRGAGCKTPCCLCYFVLHADERRAVCCISCCGFVVMWLCRLLLPRVLRETAIDV
jgi:hypothetical protein